MKIWCQCFMQCVCVFFSFCCLGFCVGTCWNQWKVVSL